MGNINTLVMATVRTEQEPCPKCGRLVTWMLKQEHVINGGA